MPSLTAARHAFFILLAFLLPAVAFAQAPAASDLAALRAAAEKGDAAAQLAYAKALPPAERAAARAWAQKSADHGLATAWFWLGYTATENEHPVSFYEQAAERGDSEAFQYVLEDLLFRAGPAADVVKAKHFADLARQRGITVGIYSAEDFAAIDQCYAAGAPDIPPADRPSPAETAALRGQPDCRTFQGEGTHPADLVRYRKCLLSAAERDHNALAEIYANGWGVKRNSTLAIALVCHGSDVPAELTGMVAALVKTRGEEKLHEPFTVCDYVTSGLNMGRCAAQGEDAATEKRDAALAKLTAGWTAVQKEALKDLRHAAETFFDQHSAGEIDLSGTARGAISIGEVSELRDDLLEAITGFEAGKLPAAGDFAKADRELNQVYAQALRAVSKEQNTTVTTKGVRDAERAWLAYRDAWVKLVAARYPQAAADRWKAWATAKRIGQLQKLMNGD
jgi:uncharacterized protein YecT (DUF1311 family)